MKANHELMLEKDCRNDNFVIAKIIPKQIKRRSILKVTAVAAVSIFS
jgi:hypothetical protein